MADPAFAGAGKKAGVEIWRIEKLKPVAVPKEDHGKFFSGDSYIVLNTKQKPGKSAFEWDIHFWLGKSTSQDEMGIAAYKTVELDDMLGGGPVQYREVQEHESQAFLSIFKGGVQYADGGVDSGFRKVERDVYETRLLQVKGRRTARARIVELSAKSLNHGDVFILDKGLTIYQWNGKDAHKLEKAKGLDVTGHIKNQERGGKAKVIVLEDGVNDEVKEFWEALKGTRADVKDASTGGDDAAFEQAAAGKLFHLQGKAFVADPAGMKKDSLKTEGIYLVDCTTELYVWVGKKSDAAARKESMVSANQYLTTAGRPTWVSIQRVAEGSETPLFKQKFPEWHEGPKLGGGQQQASASGNVAKVSESPVDLAKLHAKLAAEEEKMPDDGKGKVEVWRIEDFKKVAWDKPGQFYAGDSFIILYTYTVNTRENYIIYFWQGRDSSQDERGASALLAKELDDSLGGAATQVRVVQNKEPGHFLQLFKGKMVVHVGGKASGFKNAGDTDSYDTDGVSLYHVKGTNSLNTRAVQVPEKAASLNSGDAFILETPGVQYLWFGKGCNNDEKANCTSIAKLLQGNRQVKTIEEGSEPDDFWKPLGGKGPYADAPELKESPREARLFQCSNATGAFRVEEIFNFSQDELENDDVMILDTYNEVFVWVGANSNETERKKALETAVQYVSSATDGRDKECPIFRINAGYEPPNFTAHFLAWDPNLAGSKEDPYLAKLRAQGHDVGAAQRATDALGAYSQKFTLAQLLDRASLPREVDQSRLEDYLKDDEFQTVFKMTRLEFNSTPKWKRDTAKKAAKLY
eukprot:TRINITY_DN132_c0_g1_i1.p1 TRINITY_DN132_c0_g1~~TRINITY_DN132_c0_g1_i1.p1  ORF type:complete len:824 (-),score=219.57 TRINITY_DN132_c0_g1_i1:102-2516(-)